MLVAISGGADVKAEAAKADAAIEAHPQRLISRIRQPRRRTASRTDRADRLWQWKTRRIMEHADGITSVAAVGVFGRCPTRFRTGCPPSLALVVVMLGYPLVRLVTLSLQEFGLKQQFGAAGRLGRARQLPRRSSHDA